MGERMVAVNQELNERTISRRSFLKTAGVVAGGAALAAWLPGLMNSPALARWRGWLLRGTADGQIHASDDDGQTWRKVADFGPGCRVRRIQPGREQLQAEVEFQGRPFTLASSDAQTWYTPEYTPPA